MIKHDLYYLFLDPVEPFSQQYFVSRSCSLKLLRPQVWVLKQAPRGWSKSPVAMVRTEIQIYNLKRQLVSLSRHSWLRHFSISFLCFTLSNVCYLWVGKFVFAGMFQPLSVAQTSLRRTSCCQLSKQCFEQGMWCLQGLQGRLCSASSVHNSEFCWKKTPCAVTSLRSHFILDLSSDISVISCAVSLRHRLSLAMCQTTCQSNSHIALLFF